jgi:hypothetical protein
MRLAGRVLLALALAAGARADLHRIVRNGRYGYVDATGRVAIAARFAWADDFREGLAAVLVCGIEGYIDSTGTLAIAPQFTRAGAFRDGRALVATGGRIAFIDRAGRMLTPLYPEALDFFNGLAAVKQGALWGYIDPYGTLRIPPRFDLAGSFLTARAIVRMRDREMLIDRGGDVIETNVERVREALSGGVGEAPSADGVRRVVISKKEWGYADRSGRIVWRGQATEQPEPHRPVLGWSEVEAKVGCEAARVKPAPLRAIAGFGIGLRYDPADFTNHSFRREPKLTAADNGTDIPVAVGPLRTTILLGDEPVVELTPLADSSVTNFAAAYPQVSGAAAALKGALALPQAPGPKRLMAADTHTIDAHYSLRARLERIQTPAVAGFVFLAQYTQEEESNPANNEELRYIFLGLTRGGTHLVRASFAVSHPHLPAGVRDTGGIVRDDAGAYLRRSERLLAELPENSFRPPLGHLKNALRSLTVEPAKRPAPDLSPAWKGEWGHFAAAEGYRGGRISVQSCTEQSCWATLEVSDGAGRGCNGGGELRVADESRAEVQLRSPDGPLGCDIRLRLSGETIQIEETRGEGCAKVCQGGAALAGSFPLRSRREFFVNPNLPACYDTASAARMAICRSRALADLENLLGERAEPLVSACGPAADPARCVKAAFEKAARQENR